MAKKSVFSIFEPPTAFVDYKYSIPGFARINTPRKEWLDAASRTRTLPNGERYTMPPFKEMKGHFVMLYDWTVICKDFANNKEVTYTVPKGMSTDFASIPKALHSIMSPLSNSVYSAVLHDYLYRNPTSDEASKTSRHDADRYFYYGMKACGVRRFTALLMYWMVRMFGKSSYVR